MRIPTYIRPLAAIAILLSNACSSGTVVYSTPRPAPAPVRRLPPIEVTVVRAESGRLLLQTNRAAYIALFEIVPGRGTAVVYPQSVRQRGTMVGGLAWVSVWWAVPPAPNRRIYVDDGRPERYVYAVASDRPLRITDYSYDADYLQRTLGAEAYRGSNPYATIRALSRTFVPVMPDDQWGEDLYALPLQSARVTYRIARVYCPDGTVFEVREDMAHRAWCPPRRGRTPTAGVPASADAPDSVVSPGGRPVARRPFDPNDRTPPFRVPLPPNVSQPPATMPTEPSVVDDRDKNKEKDQDRDHDNNGRRSHGDPRNADPRGRGNGVGSGNQPRTEPQPDPKQQGQPLTLPDRVQPETGKPDKEPKVEKPDKPEKADKDKPEKPDVGPPPKVEPKPEPRPEPKPEPKPEPTPEPKVEPKPETKPEAKPEQKPEAKPENKPEKESKPSAVETLIKKRGPKP